MTPLDALENLANMALLVVAGGDTAHLEDALKQADDVLVGEGRWLPSAGRDYNADTTVEAQHAGTCEG